MEHDAHSESAARLLAALRAARPDLTIAEAVGPALVTGLAAARAAWPEVALTGEQFVEFVGPRIAGGPDPLARLLLPDLFLACACDRGDAAALAAFDRAYLPLLDRAVASLGASPAEQNELRQVVRVRLLVAREAAGTRIAGYSGRGSLGAWVRVVATREAARLLRKERRMGPAEDDALAQVLAPEASPELDYLKRLYRDEFRAALQTAVASLSDRERLLLRQHALDGLSIDQLAAFHRVHRATTARWIAAARKAVLDGTRRALTQRLRLRPAEFESILRLIDSQLDVSLPGLLRSPSSSSSG
jgi:RNA polymerase sigma-70 factor (ECF subfamily)